MLIAAFFSPNRGNVVAGVFTVYLVSTARLTVRRPVEQARGLITGFMLLALTGSGYAFSLGFEGLNSPGGRVDKVPPQPLFMFGTVALLGALGGARLLWVRSIQGAHRIARHLWRMSFAMWIATASFFLGQAKFFSRTDPQVRLVGDSSRARPCAPALLAGTGLPFGTSGSSSTKLPNNWSQTISTPA